MFPAFKNWTMKLLKQKKNYEKKFVEFEENMVIRKQVEIDQVRNIILLYSYQSHRILGFGSNNCFGN